MRRAELREHAVPVHAARLLAAEGLERLQRRVLPQQVPQVQPHVLHAHVVRQELQGMELVFISGFRASFPRAHLVLPQQVPQVQPHVPHAHMGRQELRGVSNSGFNALICLYNTYSRSESRRCSRTSSMRTWSARNCGGRNFRV